MKNKHYIAIFALLLLATTAVAQPRYSHVLKHAEEHNPMLQVAAKRAEAEKTAAHVGTLLPNPEVEAAYFWGAPAEIGIRWDLSISQSFEMPSVLVRKARLRNLQEHAAEINYSVIRKALLLEVQQECADWVYYHGVSQIYARHCAAANRLAQLFERRYTTGDCSILEYNRAQMHHASMQSKSSQVFMQEDHAAHDLHILVGDESFSFSQQEYEPVIVEPSFEDWYERFEMRNPDLQMLSNQVDASQQRLQLSRAEWLPTMSVGYASENLVGENFRGVKVGLTLPLWSQHRAVRAAQLEAEAAQQALTTEREKLFDHLRCMFHRHAALMHNVENLKASLSQYDSQEYLERALEAGEITLEQYLQQAEFYMEIELQIWEVAHELELLHLTLYAVEL
jgi:outer membrane protein TolC